MPLLPVTSDLPSFFSYREKMSWKLTKDNLDKCINVWDQETLHLARSVPGTYDGVRYSGGGKGGYVYYNSVGKELGFVTRWPKEVDLDKIHVNAEFKVMTVDGELVVAIEGGKSGIERVEFSDCNGLYFTMFVFINADLLFDEGKSIILEADIVVEMKDSGNSSSHKTDIFVKEIKSIFDDEDTSNVWVIAEGKEFKCHKNVLSARSEVFKNMLGHDTLESNLNKIVIKEITASAVEDMLKYLYSGKIPDDPKNLTTDLLQIADMHQLHPLMEACLMNFIKSLDVPSCISTFILVDNYQPRNESLREMVIEFMKCNAKEVVKEKDCDKLVDSHPALAKELMTAFASESKEKHRCFKSKNFE